MEDRVRVALSNDYEIVLRGLEALLEPYADRVSVVAASTDPDLPDSADVILFDTFGRLADADEKLRAVVASNPAARVVVYSWDSYPPEAARERGAVAWIDKALDAEQLVERLLEARDSEPFVARAPDRPNDESTTMADWPGRAEGLSPRESEVLGFICRGLTNDEIAARSFLSPHTVKTYIRTAYRKIGAGSRSQAILWGIDHGFRSDSPIGP
jgi:DNA-binding NarL/FixJ family response regulator